MPGWRNSDRIDVWMANFGPDRCLDGEIESISMSWSLQTAIFGPDVASLRRMASILTKFGLLSFDTEVFSIEPWPQSVVEGLAGF